MTNYNETVAHQIENAINTSFSPTAEAYNFVLNAHRHLQNQMAKFCIEYLLMLGEVRITHQYDERNENAAELGWELKTIMENDMALDTSNWEIQRALQNHKSNEDKKHPELGKFL